MKIFEISASNFLLSSPTVHFQKALLTKSVLQFLGSEMIRTEICLLVATTEIWEPKDICCWKKKSMKVPQHASSTPANMPTTITLTIQLYNISCSQHTQPEPTDESSEKTDKDIGPQKQLSWGMVNMKRSITWSCSRYHLIDRRCMSSVLSELLEVLQLCFKVVLSEKEVLYVNL